MPVAGCLLLCEPFAAGGWLRAAQIDAPADCWSDVEKMTSLDGSASTPCATCKASDLCRRVSSGTEDKSEGEHVRNKYQLDASSCHYAGLTISRPDHVPESLQHTTGTQCVDGDIEDILNLASSGYKAQHMSILSTSTGIHVQ